MTQAIILTEASDTIGLGHVRRCEALRDVFLSQNIDTMFHVATALTHEAFMQIGSQIDFKQYDIAVVDSYHLPQEDYQQLSMWVPHTIFFDDTLRIVYPAKSVIVNGALGAMELPYHTQQARSWLGVSYALLRDAFHKTYPKVMNDTWEHILITFGGGDLAESYIKHTIKILQKHYPKVNLIPLYPSYNLNAVEIRSLMDRACIALSASGGTLNELAICGVPTLAFCMVDNQRFNFKAWESLGFLTCDALPFMDTFESELLVNLKMLEDKTERQSMSQKAQNLMKDNHWQKYSIETLLKGR